MPKIDTIAQLDAWRSNLAEAVDSSKSQIIVCGGPCCLARGSEAVKASLETVLKAKNLAHRVAVTFSGCQGLCGPGPMVTINPQGVLYQRVQAEHAAAILDKTLGAGELLEELLPVDPASGAKVRRKTEMPFFQLQNLVLLRFLHTGDSHSLETYVAQGGYRGLSKALGHMSPEGVVDALVDSGLRGRGGAAFPAGIKWQACRKANGEAKYLIANADEGDPGSFVDRALMEGNPFALLEGMTIAAYAVGAAQGFIYLRHEYPRTYTHLQDALAQAREAGLLGDNLLGSAFSFDIKVVRGAGSYVCGEETALIASVEGHIGEPRVRPPYPVQRGLRNQPTVVNNVETLANVPEIIAQGADWYKTLGTEKSTGTKIFSLSGVVRHPGLVEVPFGMSLRQLIFEVGGGLTDKPLKAVATGGPMGSFVPAQFLDLPVAYETFQEKGFVLGHGSLIVLDEKSCMVDAARQLVAFLHAESCGKCTPCREGTTQLLKMYNDMVAGQGQPEYLTLLEELSQTMAAASFCGLGQGVANPVMSSLTYFREEYEAHIHDKICPAGVCKHLA